MWKLHCLASAYGGRPSSFLGLMPASWEAYQLDLACLEVGRWAEEKLQERDRQNRPKHHIEDLLDDATSAGGVLRGGKANAYQSAAATGAEITKMTIPADGIW